MSKLKKLVYRPGEFFKDYFVKRYPDHLTPSPVKKTKKLAAAAIHTSTKMQDFQLDAYPVTFPIDIVYTWVDGSDKSWLKKKAKFSPADTAGCVRTHPSRFECRNEILYSLKSVERYAPWANKIYIVTDGQAPEGLDEFYQNITIIDHKDIIPREFLPTFNSHVIESHLHKIPGLCEHFVYFNDDVLLTRPIKPEYFFAGNGNARLFITQAVTPDGSINFYDTPTQEAAKNVRRLLQKHFDVYMRFNFAHTFHPQLKGISEQAYDTFSDEIKAFCDGKFRSSKDIAFSTYLTPNFAYLSGKAELRTTRCIYFNIRSASAPKHYNYLEKVKGKKDAPYSMCLNDVATAKELDNYIEIEQQFLRGYFA
jgi:hypothetical protein